MADGKRLIVVALAALVLTGCSAGDDAAETVPNVVQPGAPGEPARTLAPEEVAELEPPTHTDEDVRFVQAMIHHHEQALLLASWVPQRSASKELALFARRMSISQRGEIELMETWLADRGEESADDHHLPSGWLAPGMLSGRELARLRAAKGRAFDRLFLRSMIRHHEGALAMTSELYASGGGVEPEADALARQVEADQPIEIERMKELLARLA